MPRYESIYLQRILRSDAKWSGKKVRLLRNATTKGGTKFFKGEYLKVSNVSKLGCVDLTDRTWSRRSWPSLSRARLSGRPHKSWETCGTQL